MSGHLLVRRLGAGVSFSAGLRAQRDALQQQLRVLDDGTGEPCANQLLLLEHSPVYTTGLRRGDDDQLEQTRLRALGAECVRTDRGGLITFHGPGQLVVYPILNLNSLNIDGAKRYVYLLEEAVIEACRRMAVVSTRSPHTGVWVGNNKICAMGVHFTRRVVTSHGLALNCCTDLSWFGHIVPCGIHGSFVTSLSDQLGRHVAVEEAAGHMVDALADTLRCQLTHSADVSSDARQLE